MRSPRPAALALASFLAFVAATAAAEPALRPVPVPDLSKLPASVAEQLRATRTSFDRAVANQTGDALIESYAVIASAYARAGLYAEAAVALDDVARLAPDNGTWMYAQGIVAHAQKRDAEARALFARAFAMNPDMLPVRVAFANSRLEQGDLAAARSVLSEHTARHTGDAVPFALLGDIAMREKRYADAIVQYGLALKADAAATRLYAPLADAYAAAGDAKAAAEARAKAGDGVPSLTDPVAIRFAGAAPAPSAAAQAGGGSAENPLEAVLKDADAAIASRDYARARARMEDALQLKPRDPALLGMYARIEMMAGNLAMARTRAAAAVAAGPNDASALLSQGLVFEAGGEEDAAQRSYERAIAADPKFAEPRILRGNGLMRAGRYDDASTAYRGAIAAAPAQTAGWVHLVASEVAAGRCANAFKDVNAALAKDARNGFLLQLFVRLASTCPSSGAAERKMALDYAGAMYAQADGAPAVGEAYALALAANGRWDDAVKTQQAAMFVLLRDRKTNEVGDYREFMKLFQAHKLPDRPWPPGHVLFHPQRTAPDPKPAAAPAQR